MAERIALCLDLLEVALVGQWVGLDGAAQLHGRGLQEGSGRGNFTKLAGGGGKGGFFEVPISLAEAIIPKMVKINTQKLQTI